MRSTSAMQRKKQGAAYASLAAPVLAATAGGRRGQQVHLAGGRVLAEGLQVAWQRMRRRQRQTAGHSRQMPSHLQ